MFARRSSVGGHNRGDSASKGANKILWVNSPRRRGLNLLEITQMIKFHVTIDLDVASVLKIVAFIIVLLS